MVPTTLVACQIASLMKLSVLTQASRWPHGSNSGWSTASAEVSLYVTVLFHKRWMKFRSSAPTWAILGIGFVNSVPVDGPDIARFSERVGDPIHLQCGDPAAEHVRHLAVVGKWLAN